MHRLTRIVTLLVVCSISLFMACEGPSGTEGPQGPEGPEGPVGPAGNDGSMMYSGQGAPDTNIGKTGDYYLNTGTGEMYGPKDENGWGNPIIVLMGEDGTDGQDGADGEDGSQIYSGSGAPDASLGVEGDYYLDKSNYNLYGPKTGSGWGTPLNLKGADGNANVTRYIFSGYDFSSSDFHRVQISGLSEAEMQNSAWLVYFLNDQGSTTFYYSIPGQGVSRRYSLTRNYYNGFILFDITRESTSSGVEYEQIEVVRIAASNTVDNSKQLPKDLNTNNYNSVAEYYGFK